MFPGGKGGMIEACHPGHWRVDFVCNPRLVINCFMLPITSESYPQKVDSKSLGTECVLADLMAFKRGENVLFWRVSRLHSLAWNDRNLRLVCETKPFLNRTCWTHETSMHQFQEDSESQMRTLNVEITFWSTHVFRIQFGGDSIPARASFPPPEARMLVAEPEASFEFAVEEMPGEWIARTSAVTLHVEKDPFALWASDAAGPSDLAAASFRFVYRRHFRHGGRGAPKPDGLL